MKNPTSVYLALLTASQMLLDRGTEHETLSLTEEASEAVLQVSKDTGASPSAVALAALLMGMEEMKVATASKFKKFLYSSEGYATKELSISADSDTEHLKIQEHDSHMALALAWEAKVRSGAQIRKVDRAIRGPSFLEMSTVQGVPSVLHRLAKA